VVESKGKSTATVLNHSHVMLTVGQNSRDVTMVATLLFFPTLQPNCTSIHSIITINISVLRSLESHGIGHEELK
jgi:hypothetical protein